jgi:hypothetical protein
MNLRLERDTFWSDATLGKLYVNGVYQCETLEDTVRADGVKIPGETAVPYGAYTVDITYSPKFKRLMPLLVNVKGFVGIRIHYGNVASDTEGCILVGTSRGFKRVNESRLAFGALYDKLKTAHDAGEPILMQIAPAVLQNKPG